MPARLSSEQFLEKAKSRHNNKFNYSKTNYRNWKIKVTITCPKHSDFNQRPSMHLYGQGCPRCDDDKRRLSVEEFVMKANQVHNDKYNYSKVRYINAETKITIICNEHGEFQQTPTSHTQGAGCPLCTISKGELTIKEILDKFNINYIKEYKLPEVINKFSYDFYLPDYKILIEFHGRQHYEYSPFFHRNGEDDFLAQKTRDALKIDHAIRFKYSLIEFNYKQLKHLNKEQFEQLVISRIRKFKMVKHHSLTSNQSFSFK